MDQNQKQFAIWRTVVALLIAAIVATASIINNFHLAISGVLIGMLFLYLVRKKYGGTMVDERVISISGKASRMTYVISTLFLGFFSMYLIFTGKKQNDFFLETVGVSFSYLVMFEIAIYSFSYRYFNKKYGGN